MHPPTIAVFSQVWRHRWRLLGSTVYLVCILILHLAIPKSAAFGVAQFAMVGPVLFGLIPLFAYTVDADVAGGDSTFPPQMFTLPVTSRALVGWPMLYGTVAIALAWLAAAKFLIRPAGLDVPLWWPAALLAGCLHGFRRWCGVRSVCAGCESRRRSCRLVCWSPCPVSIG